MDDDQLDGCQVALDATDGYLTDDLLPYVILFAGVAADELEAIAAYWRARADA